MVKDKKAFTLIELLVVIGIMTISVGIVLPISTSQINDTRIDAVVTDIRSRIFTLQQDSYSGKDNVGHGIYFNGSNYIIFSGNSYGSATYTNQINLSSSITFTQLSLDSNQIFFQKGSFRPNADGNIRLSDGTSTYQLSINKEGLTSVTKL